METKDPQLQAIGEAFVKFENAAQKLAAKIADTFDKIFKNRDLPAEVRFELFGVDGLDLDKPNERWIYQRWILSTPLRWGRGVVNRCQHIMRQWTNE